MTNRLTSIAITARLTGDYRVAVFPRDHRDMSTMPQDFPTWSEADWFARRLSARTGWHVVDRTATPGGEANSKTR